jgi:multimeric flavodoxin WrbA
MKIVIINGSPRRNGATAALLHSIEKQLLLLGADVEYYDLSALNMSQCRGCCVCYSTGKCIFNDDAEALSLAIGRADGLVLGSPTYASNVSGYMKLLIDRGHFVIEQLLTGKYCVTVATGENYGSKDTSRILNKLVLYSGGRLVRKVVVNVPFNSVHVGGTVTVNAGASVADKLYSEILAGKTHLGQELFHRIVFSAGIKPFVKKKGDLYKGVTEKWAEIGN